MHRIRQTPVVETIREKYDLLHGELDERRRRRWAASEAQALGHGGIAAVAKATGLAESTIRLGQREWSSKPAGALRLPAQRHLRVPGGGRKPRTAHEPALVQALEALVEPTTRGDPMSPLRWTCKSTRKLATELTSQGHPISYRTVASMLKALGDSLQGTCKTKEGSAHPDRNAQFAYLHQQVTVFQQRGQPVVSVDTKKKELVGDFANGGRAYQPMGQPELVRVSDFIDTELGNAMPYGLYDVTANPGWVSVGTDHDTAPLAVDTLRRWWQHMGNPAYPHADALLLIAEGGGSNGSRSRLWKVELQKLADATGLKITVCHLPPGTRKWHKIEHRMCCHITENWRGRPLISHAVIVNLIAHTTTHTGLRIQAVLDTAASPTGLTVTAEQMDAPALEPAPFHGTDWNYTMKPRAT